MMDDRDDQTQLNEMISLVDHLIGEREWLELPKIPKHFAGNPLFVKLYDRLLDLRKISETLGQGKLDEFVYSKGYIISNLKALQANLRHLTWQTQKIAEGDFAQQVDFLGDFSAAFNSMTAKLAEYGRTLKNLAHFDHLTKLPNRLYIDDLLGKVFNHFLKDGIPFSVVMFDIDFFKHINDTYGHGAGDIVLAKVGQYIEGSFRSSDAFARYGGEEFIAVLPNTTVQAVHEKITKIVEDIRGKDFIISDTLTIRLTISAGISTTNHEDKEFAAVVERADHALYQSKNLGRDQVTVVT